jgi:hypothetical protein
MDWNFPRKTHSEGQSPLATYSAPHGADINRIFAESVNIHRK